MRVCVCVCVSQVMEVVRSLHSLYQMPKAEYIDLFSTVRRPPPGAALEVRTHTHTHAHAHVKTQGCQFAAQTYVIQAAHATALVLHGRSTEYGDGGCESVCACVYVCVNTEWCVHPITVTAHRGPYQPQRRQRPPAARSQPASHQPPRRSHHKPRGIRQRQTGREPQPECSPASHPCILTTRRRTQTATRQPD